MSETSVVEYNKEKKELAAILVVLTCTFIVSYATFVIMIVALMDGGIA